MVNLQKVRISQFLKERVGRYRPNDEAVRSLKRLDKIDFSGNVYLTDKDSKTDMIIIEPGDLVISGINVSKGAIAVYYGEEPITATIHYSSYVFDKNQVDINYFKRFIKSPSFVQALKDQVKGGIKTEIKPKHLLPLEILLPDIDKQKEIVSFFNTAENEIDLISKNNNQQQSHIINLRQQVIQEAIEGKLTASWRREQPALISGDNHASKLLEKIEAEKERLIKEGKIKRGKPLATITDDEKPFELSEGWEWCRLGDIVNFDTGKLDSNAAVEGGIYPFFTCSKEPLEIDNYDFDCEAVLLAGNNAAGKYNVKYFKGKFNAYQRTYVITANKLMGEQFNYRFLKILLEYSLEYLREKSLGSLTQYLTLGILKPLVIAFSPLAEQGAIVELIRRLTEMIDELEKQVAERKEQSEMLMQSVMREAFATS